MFFSAARRVKGADFIERFPLATGLSVLQIIEEVQKELVLVTYIRSVHDLEVRCACQWR
jgi:hypothetical protein